MLIILLWAILVAVSGWVRPLYYSSEEMHYASIAWEMWQHHSFILPIQGGVPYAEKGPLLFWLIHIGWWLLGVSSWWMRLMPELFGLGTLLLLPKFIRLLWPSSFETGTKLASLLLLGSFFFAAKIPMMRFDVVITFLVLVAMYSLVAAIKTNKNFWLLFAVSVALGLLAKGPVMLLFVLPAAISAKWWAEESRYTWHSIYFLMSGALLLSFGLAVGWLILAVNQGGMDYATALLFKRSVSRIWHTRHYLQQNWLYYIFVLMMMLLPWIIWLPFWKSLNCFYRDIKAQGINSGLKLLFIIIGSTLLCLTFVAEKGPRYILPILPFVMVLVSYILIKYRSFTSRWHQSLIALAYIIFGLLYTLVPNFAPFKIQTKYPWLINISPFWGCVLMIMGLFWLLWYSKNLSKIVNGLTVSTVLFWSCYHLGVTKAQAQYGDWRQLAKQVQQLQVNKIPVAFAGPYQVLEYFGKLTEPLPPLTSKSQIKLWVQEHPEGWLVIRDYRISPMQLELIKLSSRGEDRENGTRFRDQACAGPRSGIAK